MRSEVCVVALSVLAAIGLGTSTCQGVVYELKQDNVTCIIINSTLVVSVDYVNNLNKTVSTSWALTKPGLNSTSGSCASRTPLHSWSEIVINATDATIGFRFVSHANGKVSLANVSLAVNIVNGSHFINPKSPSRVQFVAQLNLPLSSNTECFACKSSIALAVRPSVKTVTSTGVLKLTGGTIVQAFNLTKGKFSDKVARCPQDSNHTTTTTVAPVTTSAPASEPPLLTLTVNSSQTGKPCLRLRSRFQLEVPYLLPGMVSKAIIFLREDATATGNCGDGGSGANGTAPTHQTMTIKFFNDWLLTFSLARTGSTYSLMGLKLDYNVNNAAVFPDATDAGKNISTSRNETLISDVPSNGYYNCKLVDFSLNGRSVPLTKEVTRIKLTVTEFTMQAFRSAAINSTKEFVGEQKECMQDKVNSIVPIVVGASLAALVVIVLLAYLISRRRATARDGYQSV